ncbi:MAG: dTMP kinase [Desulfomonilia bacterium]
MIISFEGGEGVGKTSHTARLCSYLSEKGLPWISIREPGGSRFSEKIRPLFLEDGLHVMTELLLILASRKENLSRCIEPAVHHGTIVVIDRFIDSTLAYQGIVGGLGLETVQHIMEETGTWLEPDLTFVLDSEPEVSLQRITPQDKFERRGFQYHVSLRKAFLDIADAPRHRIINTDRNIRDVQDEIISRVEPCLNRILTR